MKKILSIIMSSLLLLGTVGLSSCKKKKSEEVVTTSKVVTVNGFESQLNLSTLQMFNFLGKVELNGQAEYITEGTGSAKITVFSDPIVNNTPYMLQALDHTSIGGENMTDFTMISHVGFKVYSEQESARVGVRLVYKYVADNSKQSIITWYDLNKGWNEIYHATNRDYIEDIGGGVRKVEHVGLYFERGESDGVYYFDEFKEYKTNVPTSNIETVLKENEICSFDYKWQVMSLQENKWVADKYKPLVEYNTDSKYTSTGDGGSLKLIFPAGESEDVAWPGIIIPSTAVAAIDFSIYDDNDLFCLDVYTPEDSPCKSITSLMFSIADQEICRIGHSLKAGVWTQVQFTVGEIRAKTQSSVVGFEDLAILHFTTPSRTFESIMYIDNIRMEIVD